MSDARTIELTVPGLLQFRDLAVRVVMESCKLVGKIDASVAGAGSPGGEHNGQSHALSERFDFSDEFTVEFTSAFSEIFNNIPIHAYEGKGDGLIRFEIAIGLDHLVVRMIDTGKSFDIQGVPLPDELPVGGMGLHIARTMLDELDYQPGPPNCWRLVKYLKQASSQSRTPQATPPE